MGDFLINFRKKKIIKYILMCSQIRSFQIKMYIFHVCLCNSRNSELQNMCFRSHPRKTRTFIFFSFGKLSVLCQRVPSLTMAHPMLCKTKYDLLSISKFTPSKFIMIYMNHAGKSIYAH